MNAALQGSEDAIVVDDISKVYRLNGGAQSLKSRVIDMFKGGGRRGELFKALDGVSFRVAKGETLGIIGANGAGKSTLLALLTGTIQPTTGSLWTTGQISSLLELGAGFHPELTGRENVFLYGAIMGISRSQMAERFDAIVNFAGLHQFIDQPVKYYSSGMYVRLGFAVAVEVNPDILLIDEVLAVGDSVFQKKCIDKMNEFRSQGKTMLIISHDLHTIQRISDRILFLDRGQLLGLGTPDSMIDEYQGLVRQREADAYRREWGTGKVRINSVTIQNRDGEMTDKVKARDGFRVVLSYEVNEPVDSPVFGFGISDRNGRLVHGCNTQKAGVKIEHLSRGGQLVLSFDPLPLIAGNYLMSFSVHSFDHKENYHRLDNAFPIVIESDTDAEGVVELISHWEGDDV